MKYKKDSGRSMIEMLGYLALIMVITITTIKTYSESVEKTKGIKADAQIDDIVDVVKTYYFGRSFSAETDVSTKISSLNKVSLYAPWGGKIYIYSKKHTDGNSYFDIIYEKLQKSACVKVVSLFIQKGATSVSIDTGKTMKISTTKPTMSLISSCADGKNVHGVFDLVK